MLITSRDNTLLRQARAVRDGKTDDLIFIEGLRLSEEALLSHLDIYAVIFSNQLARKQNAASVISQLKEVAKHVGAVSEKLLESISFTKTPQGIVVLAARPTASRERLEASMNTPLLVVMHELNNPINVGAVLRTAEASGVTAVITTRNTSDPFSPRSLRGAMGSAFRLPIWSGASYEEVIEWCHQHEIAAVCSDAGATLAYTDVDWTVPSALILGPESAGLSNAELSVASAAVRIPMMGQVESLNVSVAAGIMLYEAARQRKRLENPVMHTRVDLEAN